VRNAHAPTCAPVSKELLDRAADNTSVPQLKIRKLVVEVIEAHAIGVTFNGLMRLAFGFN